MASPAPDQRPNADGSSASTRPYENVSKPQEYRFAESAEPERFDEAVSVPVCDIRPLLDEGAGDPAAAAAALGGALETLGFAILVGHGIDLALHAAAHNNNRALFESTDEEQRRAFPARRVGAVNQGYFPLKETSGLHPDLVLGWVFGPDDFAGEGRWPAGPWRGFFEGYVRAHRALAPPLIRALLGFLGLAQDRLDPALERATFALRLNYYPPTSEADLRSGAGRLLGHEDVTLITLLPAPLIEGLQVLNPSSGNWVRVAAPPGSIIMNVGDYLQRISNDRLRSTTHRVSPPRDPAARSESRTSAPINIYLHPDEELAVLPGLGPPRYPPVRAADFHLGITRKYYGEDHGA